MFANKGKYPDDLLIIPARPSTIEPSLFGGVEGGQ
jgi:hypothetical protein